jgi:hypothetical protein
MKSENYSTTITVDQSPSEAFAAINDVRGWWSGSPGVEGRSDTVGAEFTYRYDPYHYSKQKVTELVPGKRVAWSVTDAKISFVEDKTEWTGTTIVFDIAQQGDKTEVRFTHVGLIPNVECFNACSDAWGGYIKGSLKDLITKGHTTHPMSSTDRQ